MEYRQGDRVNVNFGNKIIEGKVYGYLASRDEYLVDFYPETNNKIFHHGGASIKYTYVDTNQSKLVEIVPEEYNFMWYCLKRNITPVVEEIDYFDKIFEITDKYIKENDKV